ncbi:MAG TPA: hypothetical protein VJ804_03215 [Acidimicrobiales bacterium]|nr:hypothetical protein [Acidimicrobiales bacterium]
MGLEAAAPPAGLDDRAEGGGRGLEVVVHVDDRHGVAGRVPRGQAEPLALVRPRAEGVRGPEGQDTCNTWDREERVGGRVEVAGAGLDHQHDAVVRTERQRVRADEVAVRRLDRECAEEVLHGPHRHAALGPQPTGERAEVVQRLLDRLRHQVADGVAHRVEGRRRQDPCRHAGVVGPPAGAEPHPRQRVLLGQVVEEVPSQVVLLGPALDRAREGEEPRSHDGHDARASSCSR